MPDYAICMSKDGDQSVLQNRGTTPAPLIKISAKIPRPDPNIYDMAREPAPG